MVYRDPQTGQFRSGDGGSKEYFDLEVQNVYTRYHLDAADVPEAFPAEDTVSREVANGLGRTEEAELIMLRLHGFQATAPGTASAENALEASFELSFDSNMQLTGIENPEDSAGEYTIRSATSDMPDVLWFTHQTSEGSWSDTATGVGGGSDAPVQSDAVHFPGSFGAGPVVTGRDNLYEHINLGQSPGATIEDSEIDVYAAYTLYWDVRDRD